MKEAARQRRIRMLAEDLGCGGLLARDLLVLAGDDEELVRKASSECKGVESVKAYIIDHRLKRHGI